MEIVIILCITIIVIYLIRKNVRSSKHDDLMEKKQLHEFLSYTIAKKEKELEQLEIKLSRNVNDKSLSLNNESIKVLTIYEQSGIRIPLDILEELSYMNFTEPKDIFKFIENQRHFWTLENRKKPYREVK